MGFLSSIVGATVKTVLTPVALVKDVANVVTGEEPNATKKAVESIQNDTAQAIDDLVDGEI